MATKHPRHITIETWVDALKRSGYPNAVGSTTTRQLRPPRLSDVRPVGGQISTHEDSEPRRRLKNVFFNHEPVMYLESLKACLQRHSSVVHTYLSGQEMFFAGDYPVPSGPKSSVKYANGCIFIAGKMWSP